MRSGEEITEQELTILCSKGSGLARKELYTRYATRIHALCYRYLGDSDRAKDLTHDLILKLFDTIGRYHYKGEGSLWAWIRRMTINAAINRVTRKGIVDFGLENIEEQNMAEPLEDGIETVSVPIILHLISGLPDTQRLILNMFCLDGYSHKEIALMLGITEKASSSLLAKAKKTLWDKIEEYSMR